MLGGGPRAFTKYEAGTIRPRASVVRLLRVLDQNPDALASLTGGDRLPASGSEVLPFEVTGEHIALLTERTLPVLLRRLLSAEPKRMACLSTEFTLQAISRPPMVERTVESRGPTGLPKPRSCLLDLASSS